MKLKEVNQEYHFEKAKLKQWLIDQGLIEPHDHRDIYQLECDTEMIQMIDDDQYAIRHTVVRKKFQTIDDYQAPAMICFNKTFDTENMTALFIMKAFLNMFFNIFQAIRTIVIEDRIKMIVFNKLLHKNA